MLNDYTNLSFPTSFNIVVAEQVTEKNLLERKRIPMKFWIQYPDVYDLTPPELTLLVNPNTFNMSFSKKINPTFTRQGIIVEHWGEMLDTINVEGQIGAYYIYTGNSSLNNSSNNRLVGGEPTSVNLTRTDRASSPSFRNIYSLYLLYKNNGYVYTESRSDININVQTISLVQTRLDRQQNYKKLDAKNRIDKIGSVFFQYDDSVYEGSFDEFTMEEDAKNPFTLKYSFQFTVRQRLIIESPNKTGLTTYASTKSTVSVITGPSESTTEGQLENLPDLTIAEWELPKEIIVKTLSSQIQESINTTSAYNPLDSTQTSTLNNIVQEKVNAIVTKDYSANNAADNAVRGFFQNQKSEITTKAEASSDADMVIRHVIKQTKLYQPVGI